MYVRPPLQLAGLGLQNERYAGPDFTVGSSITPGSDAHPIYLENGIHLRWAFPRRIGWPLYGFQVFRRPAAQFTKTSFTITPKGQSWLLGGANRGLASIGASSANGFSLNFNQNVAAVLITYTPRSGRTLAPRTLKAYGLTPLASGMAAVTPTIPNLGDADAPAGDVVVIQPNRVDLGSVYTHLGDALASRADTTDPFYGAYLAGLFDDDEDNDESFGSAITGGVPGDNDRDDADVAWYRNTYPGGSGLRAPGTTPWLRQLVVQLPTAAVTGLQFEIVLPADMPSLASWPPTGWTKIADLAFPASKAEAVARVLATPFPADWGDSGDPNTTAGGLLAVYGELYRQLANTGGGTIDPTAVTTVNPQGDGPAAGLNAVQIRMADVLLALSVDHRLARMFGLSFCDATATGAGDYLVAAYWTQPPSSGTPDYFATALRVPLTHHQPLVAPVGLTGTPSLQGTGQSDDTTISTSTQTDLPAIGLTWDLQMDPNAPDGDLQPGAPAAFNLYRAHDRSGHPGDGPAKINTQPLVVSRSRDPKTGVWHWPKTFYLDDRDDASPGHFGLLSGSYEYQISGIDLFGRISPASAWTPPIAAPKLPGPPPPVFVTARFLDSHDPFLSDVESAIIGAVGSSTAHVIWHWTGDRVRQAIAQSFRLYYLPALPQPVPVRATLRGTPADGTILMDITPTPPNIPALVNGRLVQGGYDLAISDLGGVDTRGTHVPGGSVQLEPKQWRILSVDRTGTHLVLGRLPDRDGSIDYTTEGIVPSNGTVQLRYDLTNRTLWRAVPSSDSPRPAGVLPPPPAGPLIVPTSGGDKRLILENPGLLPLGTVLLVGRDPVKVSSVSGQTIALANTVPDGHVWPVGTPVTANWLSAAVTPGSGTVILGNTVGIRPGQTIAIGLPPRASSSRTTLVGNVATGPQSATPLTMDGIVTGATLVIDDGDAAEVVNVDSVSSTTFHATFSQVHGSGVAITIGILPSAAASVVVKQVSSPSGIENRPALLVASTTIPAGVRASSVVAGPSAITVQPGSMNGIHTGTVLIVDTDAHGEAVTVQSTMGSSFTATYAHPHDSGTPIVVAQTKLTGSVGSGPQHATPATMQNIVPGSQLLIDAGPSSEIVVVTTVDVDSNGRPTAFIATFAFSHSSGAPVAIVDAVENRLVTTIDGSSGNTSLQLPLLVPWPQYAPVSVVDIPYDWAPAAALFRTFGLLPDTTRNQIKAQGYFALSTVAQSYQDGSPLEGPLSAPAYIDTVLYTRPDVSRLQLPPAQPPCDQISIVYGDTADVHGVSRITVAMPDPPAGQSTYAEVWRTTEDRVFEATGQIVSLADTCPNHWALMQLADSAIDRTAFNGSQTTITGASAGDTVVTLADPSGAAAYRKLVFLDPAHPQTRLETVTVARGGIAGGQITFFPPLQHSYPGGSPVLFQSQGMGPFVLVSKESVPWSHGGTYVDVLHGLSDNLYLYSFVALPVQTDTGRVDDATHHVQAAGMRSLASGVTRPYAARPSQPPVVPSPVKANSLQFLQIQLQWNYDPPSSHKMDSPPTRTYTVYRTTDPNATTDIRLMSRIKQIANFAPPSAALAQSVPSPGGIAPLVLDSKAANDLIADGVPFAIDTGDRYEVVVAQAVKNSSGTITGYQARFTRPHNVGARVVGGFISFTDGVDAHGAVNYKLVANAIINGVPTPVNYYYRITAADAFSNISDASKAAQVRAMADNPPPPPTNLRATAARGGVQLQWVNPQPGYQIQIQRRDNPNGTFWQTIPLVAGPPGTLGKAGVWSAAGLSRLLDSTAVPTKRYEYRVLARSKSLYTVTSGSIIYNPP